MARKRKVRRKVDVRGYERSRRGRPEAVRQHTRGQDVIDPSDAPPRRPRGRPALAGVRLVHYGDTGQDVMYAEWADGSTTEGEPGNPHMAALYQRAEREGLPIRRESTGGPEPGPEALAYRSRLDRLVWAAVQAVGDEDYTGDLEEFGWDAFLIEINPGLMEMTARKEDDEGITNADAEFIRKQPHAIVFRHHDEISVNYYESADDAAQAMDSLHKSYERGEVGDEIEF